MIDRTRIPFVAVVADQTIDGHPDSAYNPPFVDRGTTYDRITIINGSP
jgi:hypothetical protein